MNLLDRYLGQFIWSPLIEELAMPSYDNYISDDADGFDRHDNFIEAQCSFCNTWEICIECAEGYICEECQNKAEE